MDSCEGLTIIIIIGVMGWGDVPFHTRESERERDFSFWEVQRKKLVDFILCGRWLLGVILLPLL